MGARWAWCAVCVNGHIFSNFSGGSDSCCYECEGDIVTETACDAEPDGDCRPALKEAYEEYKFGKAQMSFPFMDTVN